MTDTVKLLDPYVSVRLRRDVWEAALREIGKRQAKTRKRFTISALMAEYLKRPESLTK